MNRHELPGRPLLMDHLARSIVAARRHAGHHFSVLLIDLDRSEGRSSRRHAVGSAGLLAAVAQRIEARLGKRESGGAACRSHLVARLRDDEVAVLLDGIPDAADARLTADRILADLLAPLSAGGRDVYLAPSIGVAVGGPDCARAEDVLRDADAALHRAKLLGKARSEVFDAELATAAESKVRLESDIRAALDRGQFVLHFQPIVELGSTRTVGFEALVRWEHPSLGVIQPGEFIPLAEQTGLITALGSWALREACRRLKSWHTRGQVPGDVWVSVNLSSPQFSRPGFADQIASILSDTGLDARCLMLELTESVAMENAAAVRSTIANLRALGARVGLDDFGTGQSSLAYLHQFPSDVLKLDRTFVRDMGARGDVRNIVAAVITLAAQLGLSVIAEGIETREQADLARSLGCAYGQGFYFSPPLDQAGAAAFLQAGLPPLLDRGAVPAGPSPEDEDGLLPFDPPSRWTGWARPPAFAPAAAVCR